MDRLELFDADLGVNGGGFELFVAEESLDEPDVGPAFQHVGGAGGANQMATSGAADVGLLDPFADHAAEHVGIERLAVNGEEDSALVVFHGLFEVAGASSFLRCIVNVFALDGRVLGDRQTILQRIHKGSPLPSPL